MPADRFNPPLRGPHDVPLERPAFLWNQIVRYLSHPAVVLDVTRGHGPDRWRYKLQRQIRDGGRWRREIAWADQAMVSPLVSLVETTL